MTEFRSYNDKDSQVSTIFCASKEHVNESPRFYYGWIMLPIAMLGLIATSPGQTYGVSVFIEPMRLTLGLSQSQIAAAYTLGSLLGALPIILFGTLMDRFGLRIMMFTSVILFGGACFVAASATGWFTLFLSFLLLRMLGPGVIALLCGTTLPFWFHQRLGTVEGIRQLGVACSMILIPSCYLYLYESLGWRGSYMALGMIVCVVMLPLILLFYRNSPADVGQHIDGQPEDTSAAHSNLTVSIRESFTVKQALSTPTFWIVASGTGMYGMIQTGIFFSIVPIVEELNLSQGLAVSFLARFALSLAAMQLIGGMLSDQFAARGLLLLALVGFAASMALLWKASVPSDILWSGLLMGATQGLFFGVSNPLWARYFGRHSLGKIRGSLMTFMVACSSLGPLIIGLNRDWTGSYSCSLATFALIPLPLAGLMLLATPPSKSASLV